ncbi:hypothetical protein IWQ60_000482 [Tieghemiomyces parasiticus]|uniref:Rab3 GTPase-activating protein catalytic subunit n=1 Tax=Tieghemiomyces parasiticus TaxID=78921 RepID=A0A9W8AG11_9FUNG|nr:hypothetical protein IWQ60_000482 [Tieghemiomyces parasiticus]
MATVAEPGRSDQGLGDDAYEIVSNTPATATTSWDQCTPTVEAVLREWGLTEDSIGSSGNRSRRTSTVTSPVLTAGRPLSAHLSNISSLSRPAQAGDPPPSLGRLPPGSIPGSPTFINGVPFLQDSLVQLDDRRTFRLAYSCHPVLAAHPAGLGGVGGGGGGAGPGSRRASVNSPLSSPAPTFYPLTPPTDTYLNGQPTRYHVLHRWAGEGRILVLTLDLPNVASPTSGLSPPRSPHGPAAPPTSPPTLSLASTISSTLGFTSAPPTRHHTISEETAKSLLAILATSLRTVRCTLPIFIPVGEADEQLYLGYRLTWAGIARAAPTTTSTAAGPAPLPPLATETHYRTTALDHTPHNYSYVEGLLQLFTRSVAWNRVLPGADLAPTGATTAATAAAAAAESASIASMFSALTRSFRPAIARSSPGAYLSPRDLTRMAVTYRYQFRNVEDRHWREVVLAALAANTSSASATATPLTTPLTSPRTPSFARSTLPVPDLPLDPLGQGLLAALSVGPLHNPLVQIAVDIHFPLLPCTRYLSEDDEVILDASRSASAWTVSGQFVGPAHENLRLSDALEDSVSYWIQLNDYAHLRTPSSPASLVSSTWASVRGLLPSTSSRLSDTLPRPRRPSKVDLPGDCIEALQRTLEIVLDAEYLPTGPPSDPGLGNLPNTIVDVIGRSRHGTAVPFGSVLWNLVHLLTNVTRLYSTPFAPLRPTDLLRVLWPHFVRALRWHWENLILIPHVNDQEIHDIYGWRPYDEDTRARRRSGNPLQVTLTATSHMGSNRRRAATRGEEEPFNPEISPINLRYNVLHQKLAMLNACIASKRRAERKLAATQGAEMTARYERLVRTGEAGSDSGGHLRSPAGSPTRASTFPVTKFPTSNLAPAVHHPVQADPSLGNRRRRLMSFLREGRDAQAGSDVTRPWARAISDPDYDHVQIPESEYNRLTDEDSDTDGAEEVAIVEPTHSARTDAFARADNDEGDIVDDDDASSIFSDRSEHATRSPHLQPPRMGDPAMASMVNAPVATSIHTPPSLSSNGPSLATVLASVNLQPNNDVADNDVPTSPSITSTSSIQLATALLREGHAYPADHLTLLGSGEPMWIPETQESPLMTEDMLQDQEQYLVGLGASPQAALRRAQTLSAQLFSDMQAFKAANPGCVLADFVRWHSPRDWVTETVEEDTRDEGTSRECGGPQPTSPVAVSAMGNALVRVASTRRPKGRRVAAGPVPEGNQEAEDEQVTVQVEGEPWQDSATESADEGTNDHRPTEPTDPSCPKVEDTNPETTPQVNSDSSVTAEPVGQLSLRMSEPDNLWQQLWAAARPVPISRQKPLFSHRREADQVLSFLEALSAEDVFRHLLPTTLLTSYQALRATPVVTHLPYLRTHLQQFADEFRRFDWPHRAYSGSTVAMDRRRERLMSQLRTVESGLGRALALLHRFPRQFNLVNRLLRDKEATVDLTDQIPGLTRLVSTAGRQPVDGSSGNDENVPLGSLYAVGSRQARQRRASSVLPTLTNPGSGGGGGDSSEREAVAALFYSYDPSSRRLARQEYVFQTLNFPDTVSNRLYVMIGDGMRMCETMVQDVPVATNK